MNIINSHRTPEELWESPGGKFGGHLKELSRALGSDDTSSDLRKRHPFDVAITRIDAGKAVCPFHSHSAQWEFYHVMQGRGFVRDHEGRHALEPGDAFLFQPDEPHQLIAADDSELVVMVIADNPVGESCHYPDSGKWMVRSPEKRIIRSENLDYFDGEE